MPTRDENLGQIDISSSAVATVANQAIHQCYGVVGMASKNLADGIANLLTRDSRRGIEIRTVDDGVEIDAYVIVQYGVRIKTVAESIQHTIKFHVEKAIGLPVHAVNVYIQGLRFNPDNQD